MTSSLAANLTLSCFIIQFSSAGRKFRNIYVLWMRPSHHDSTAIPPFFASLWLYMKSDLKHSARIALRSLWRRSLRPFPKHRSSLPALFAGNPSKSRNVRPFWNSRLVGSSVDSFTMWSANVAGDVPHAVRTTCKCLIRMLIRCGRRRIASSLAPLRSAVAAS